ncbi:MAG: hypothetical protein ACYTE3_30965, partial [Planctomycetota bacterium]
TTDFSQARTPDGAERFEFPALPTPGVANPSSGTTTVAELTLVTEDAEKRVLVPTGDIGQTWRTPQAAPAASATKEIRAMRT